EYDSENKYVTLTAPDTWRVDGRLPAEDAVALGWPVCESDDYETIAGWFLDAADEVPSMGDELVVDGYSFRVEKMRRSRISIIRVQRRKDSE
ncbi:MAG: HlyC/CorC family transporter, partial [Eggerthellaceae bacterium]|nr:HlyC/CorC family transporter [Eggerthellaceae bacterium]